MNSTGHNSPRTEGVEICHVAVGDLWAGAEVQLRTLLSQLVKVGEFSLSVVLFNGGRLEREIADLGIPVTIFPERQWGSRRIFRELIRRFRQSHVRIVHTHKYKDTILGAPSAKLCGVPYVVRTVHGLSEPFEGMRALKMNLYEAIEHMVHRCCVDTVIGVSSQIEQQYESKRRVPRVVYIRNGIEIGGSVTQIDRRHKRTELGIETETCLIGAIGRLTPVKGFQYLLDAAKILVDKGSNVKFLLIGDGELRRELEAQIRQLRISEYVELLGHREDTEELVYALDIFVLPSLSEGIPMALLEAMAASRAIVASRVGGVPDVIRDGIDGLLVEPMDVGGLARRCLDLMQSPELREQVGLAAKSRVHSEFSASTTANRVAAVYRELLVPRKPR